MDLSTLDVNTLTKVIIDLGAGTQYKVYGTVIDHDETTVSKDEIVLATFEDIAYVAKVIYVEEAIDDLVLQYVDVEPDFSNLYILSAGKWIAN